MDLTIRKMRERDFEPLFALLSNEQVMRYLEPPYTEERTASFLKTAGLSDSPLIYAVEGDGHFIGYIIFHDYDESSVEIGWVLHPSCWGMGCASCLTEQLIDQCRVLGKQPVIECSPEQEITKHIAQKYGFEYMGNEDGLDVFRRANSLPLEGKVARRQP